MATPFLLLVCSEVDRALADYSLPLGSHCMCPVWNLSFVTYISKLTSLKLGTARICRPWSVCDAFCGCVSVLPFPPPLPRTPKSMFYPAALDKQLRGSGPELSPWLLDFWPCIQVATSYFPPNHLHSLGKQNQSIPFGYVTLAPNRSTQTGLNLTFSLKSFETVISISYYWPIQDNFHLSRELQ